MKKNIFMIFGLIFGIIGALFFVLGVIFAFAFDFEPELAGLYITFVALGALFLLTALSFPIIAAAKRARINRLVRTGEVIYGEVEDVVINSTISVNGSCPYQVRVKVYENGVKYLFKSENIWNYPELTGANARVYYKAGNMKNYYVDLTDAVVPTVEM